LSEFLGIISVLVGFICLVLAVFLFLAKTERKLPNQFFGAFLLLTAVDISGWFILGRGWEAPWLEAFRSVLGALQMPLFLGFIASTCYSNFKLKKWDTLHALPFLFGVYLRLPGNQLFWAENESSSLYFTEAEAIFTLIISHVQYYLYIAAAVCVLWRFKTIIRRHYADARSDVFIWLSQLVAVSIFAHTLLLIRHIAAFGTSQSFFQILQAIGAITILAVITWVTLKALIQPELFRGIDHAPLRASNELGEKVAETSRDSDQEDKLLAYMENHKPYLDPQLTLQTLADQLALTPRELSELINGAMGMHFFDFVNSYRINAAKTLLLEERTKTVLDVLYRVGFNSKSSFNTAFKKHVQMTPTAYRKANSV